MQVYNLFFACVLFSHERHVIYPVLFLSTVHGRVYWTIPSNAKQLNIICYYSVPLRSKCKIRFSIIYFNIPLGLNVKISHRLSFTLLMLYFPLYQMACIYNYPPRSLILKLSNNSTYIYACVISLYYYILHIIITYIIILQAYPIQVIWFKLTCSFCFNCSNWPQPNWLPPYAIAINCSSDKWWQLRNSVVIYHHICIIVKRQYQSDQHAATGSAKYQRHWHN